MLCCFFAVSDNDAEGDDEGTRQSSLDVNAIARQALKRRASDSYRTQVAMGDVACGKGSKTLVEVLQCGIQSVMMYMCVKWRLVT